MSIATIFRTIKAKSVECKDYFFSYITLCLPFPGVHLLVDANRGTYIEDLRGERSGGDEKTKQKIKFMQNSSGKRIEASQGKLNEVIKATAVAAHIFV